jgi:hypothetical protein
MPANTSIAQFQPLEWVNDYTRAGSPINEATFGPILHFSLMWNLFERDACGREANPANIERSVQTAFAEGKLSLDAFQEHLDYFQNRAQRDNMTIIRYLEALKLTNANARNLVRGVLAGDLSDPNNVVYALLLIAHRIRNNLFHGEKEVANLHSQVDLFRAVNSLLATFLNQTRMAD